MSSRVEASLRVRGYEVNHLGFVSAATLLRYCEHVRWETLSSKELDLGRLLQDDHRLVVRATQLEVGVAVGLGNDLRLSVWLDRVGNASMDLAHAVHRVDDGAVVARALVTAVYLAPNRRPARLPDDVRQLARAPQSAPLAPPLTDTCPESAWTRRIAVVPSDLDLYRHVNQARYLDHVEDGCALAARAPNSAPWPVGPAPRVVRAHLDHVHEAVLGDEIEARIWRISGDAWTAAVEMRRASDATVLCRARAELAPT